jgi:hypothetical protein
MKNNLIHPFFKVSGIFLIACFLLPVTSVDAQITPPGYEREMRRLEEGKKISPLERDSLTLVDTSMVFDPETYESEVIITRTRYSIKDYCKSFLGINDPDILLDRNPHTIIDPRTYEDLIIRLNSSGKIDTIPK